jgi:hypothetical protein
VADVLSKARGDNALSDYPLAFPYRIADCCWEAVHFGRVPELPFINGTAGLEPSTYGEREPHHWIQRNAQSGMYSQQSLVIAGKSDGIRMELKEHCFPNPQISCCNSKGNDRTSYSNTVLQFVGNAPDPQLLSGQERKWNHGTEHYFHHRAGARPWQERHISGIVFVGQWAELARGLRLRSVIQPYCFWKRGGFHRVSRCPT